jgi:hypothetical protein
MGDVRGHSGDGYGEICAWARANPTRAAGPGTPVSPTGRWPPRRAGVRLTDLGPMPAGRRNALLELGLRDRAFGWPLEMVLHAAQAGWQITEVPVRYRPRAGRRSKVTGSVRGSLRAVRDMATVLR